MPEKKEPITFTEPAYCLFDVEANGVLTTEIGNLAIFSTEGMAKQVASTSRRKLEVLPVSIKRIIQ